MAQVDPNIAMGIRPVQIPLEESPLNRLRAHAEFANAMQQQQMNALKFEEAKREAQERNALAQLDPSSPGYLTQLKRVNPKLALEYQKAGLEAESADITRQKNKSELFQTKLKESRYFLEGFDVNSPTAADDYIAWAESNINDPV